MADASMEMSRQRSRPSCSKLAVLYNIVHMGADIVSIVFFRLTLRLF